MVTLKSIQTLKTCGVFAVVRALILCTLAATSCSTIHEYPISPYTCQYEGGINLSNAKMLQVEQISTSMMRPGIFNDRKAVKISGNYYTLDSFRPVLMCVDPILSAEIPPTADQANSELQRRYTVMFSVFMLAPALPVVAPLAAAAGISATFGVVGYLHSRFFEPSREKLELQAIDYNRKVAELVRTRNETSPVARAQFQPTTGLDPAIAGTNPAQ